MAKNSDQIVPTVSFNLLEDGFEIFYGEKPTASDVPLSPISCSDLLKKITQKYIESSDFNGLPLFQFLNVPNISNTIIELISREKIDLVRGDGHPNPHIKALSAEPPEVQLEKIRKHGLNGGCLYPTSQHLESIYAAQNEARPFTKELMLGAPQLDFRVFDLRLLEWYRNDPRYRYEVDDIHGVIEREKSIGSEQTNSNDKLEFFEFGFAYDESLNRAVAIFLRYLHDKTLEEQNVLAQYQVRGNYHLHPDYFRTNIIGDFPERMSIYDVFLEERWHINEISKIIGREPFYKTQTKAHERPRGFGILIRPTKKEYQDFVMLTNKLLNDDINRKFFKDDVLASEQLIKSDGSTTEKPLGTITVLQNWLSIKFRTSDQNVVPVMLKKMRLVNKERQSPAHKLEDNSFDQLFLKKQRDAIVAAYDAVRTLRMILEKHPKAREYANSKIPNWLREGKVWEI